MTNSVIQGDCREVMRSLIDEGVRVQCVVTSPPYWGLRDYGVDGQLGLEASPAEYVESMVEVFGLVRELLADDGTLWLNLGDSYAASQSNNGGYSAKSTLAGFTSPNTKGRQANNAGERRRLDHSLKPKDLCGIPWRVAFALQDAGWWLRQDIIWSKPNPMPESVRDRCTKAHEYLFLLTKRDRYYYDAEAIQEPASDRAGGNTRPIKGAEEDPIKHRTRVGLLAAHQRAREEGGFQKRNRRSVWHIATQSYPESHFATMPEALVEPCILAGSKPGDLVFDPFMGSGTVASVAQRLGRRWLGTELNEKYIALIEQRTRGTLGLELSAHA